MCCTITCVVVVDGTCCHVLANASPAWWRCTLLSLHLRGVALLSPCHLRGGTVALHHLRGDVLHVSRGTCVVSLCGVTCAVASQIVFASPAWCCTLDGRCLKAAALFVRASAACCCLNLVVTCVVSRLSLMMCARMQ